MPRNNHPGGRPQAQKSQRGDKGPVNPSVRMVQDHRAPTSGDESLGGRPRRASRRRGRERQLRVRSVRRTEPDVGKIARAVIAMAMAQAEKDAEQEDPSRAA